MVVTRQDLFPTANPGPTVSAWDNLDSGEAWVRTISFVSAWAGASVVTDTNATPLARTQVMNGNVVTVASTTGQVGNTTDAAANVTRTLASMTYVSSTTLGYIVVTLCSYTGADPSAPTLVRSSVTFASQASLIYGSGTKYRLDIFTVAVATGPVTGTTTIKWDQATTSGAAQVFQIGGALMTGTTNANMVRNAASNSSTSLAASGTLAAALTVTNKGASTFATWCDNSSVTTNTIVWSRLGTKSVVSGNYCNVATPNTRGAYGWCLSSSTGDDGMDATTTATYTNGTAGTLTAVGILAVELVPAADAYGVLGGGAAANIDYRAGTQTECDVEVLLDGGSNVIASVPATTGQPDRFGVVVRRNAAADTYIFACIEANETKNTTNLKIFAVVAGTWTTIVAYSFGATAPKGLRFQCYDEPGSTGVRVRLRGWTTTEGTTWQVDQVDTATLGQFRGVKGTTGIMIDASNAANSLGSSLVPAWKIFQADTFKSQALFVPQGQGGATGNAPNTKTIRATPNGQGTSQATSPNTKAIGATPGATGQTQATALPAHTNTTTGQGQGTPNSLTTIQKTISALTNALTHTNTTSTNTRAIQTTPTGQGTSQTQTTNSLTIQTQAQTQTTPNTRTDITTVTPKTGASRGNGAGRLSSVAGMIYGSLAGIGLPAGGASPFRAVSTPVSGVGRAVSDVGPALLSVATVAARGAGVAGMAGSLIAPPMPINIVAVARVIARGIVAVFRPVGRFVGGRTGATAPNGPNGVDGRNSTEAITEGPANATVE